jgi:tripartite-type tricarboxylate transporter receptor subunit TctC
VLTAAGVRAEASYPTRAVKVIVPLPAGSEPVAAFRVIADRLQDRWGQPVVVEARPGASQNLGADAVARAEPDGYTLLFTPPAPLVTSKWMFKSLSYNPDTFTPVSITFQFSLVLTIGPTVPASTFAELIAYAKANPGKLTYASPGVTTIPYLSMEALLRHAGISMVHVAYTALPQGQLDLIAGRIDVILDPAPSRAIEFYLDGKLRILAVASAARHPRLPDVPAISEVLPGYEKVDWLGVVAPPNTPAEIAEKLSHDIAQTLRMPDVAERLAPFGFTPVEGTPADLAARIRTDSEYWRGVIDAVGLTKSK